MSKIKVLMIKDILCFEWSSDAPASINSKYYKTKITVSCESEVYYCDYTCKAGEDNEENEKNNMHNKNILCVHVLSCFIKICLLLFNFLADDICFEIAALSRRSEGFISFNINDITIIHESLVILASTAFTSKIIDVPVDLRKKIYLTYAMITLM